MHQETRRKWGFVVVKMHFTRHTSVWFADLIGLHIILSDIIGTVPACNRWYNSNIIVPSRTACTPSGHIMSTTTRPVVAYTRQDVLCTISMLVYVVEVVTLLKTIWLCIVLCPQNEHPDHNLILYYSWWLWHANTKYETNFILTSHFVPFCEPRVLHRQFETYNDIPSLIKIWCKLQQFDWLIETYDFIYIFDLSRLSCGHLLHILICEQVGGMLSQ